MAGLEAQLGGNAADDDNETARRLSAARAELGAAREKYGPDHPDVLRLQREVAGLQESLRTAANSAGPPRSRDEGADNPAYIQLRSQRVASMNERASLQTQAQQVRARLDELERRQTAAPAVEREYSALARDLLNEREKYAEVRQKQMEAQLVQNLETERKGERFTLIEPPLQPSEPRSPNRPLILVLGLVLAIGAAAATVVLLEKVDTRIRDRVHLLSLVGVPALAVVPVIEIAEDIQRRGRIRRNLIFVAGACLVVALVILHFFVMPLDVMSIAIARRLGV